MERVQKLFAGSVIALAAVGVGVGGCSGPATSTTAPVNGGPYSQIAPQIQLPPGSTRDTGTDAYSRELEPRGLEVWDVPGGLDDAVKTMRGRLPIGQPLDGLPWQGESQGAGCPNCPNWTWATSTRQIYVGFMYLDVRGPDNGVHITIGTGPPENAH